MSKIPLVILISFIILVPLARCTLFFDSYLIKLWIVESGIAIVCIYYLKQLLWKQAKLQINPVRNPHQRCGIPLCGIISNGVNPLLSILLLGYLFINITSWILIPSPYKYPGLLTLASLIFYILLCFFVSQYLREDNNRVLTIYLWIITTGFISIYGIWQYLHGARVIGTLGNENFLASHIGISIPVCIGLFSRLRTRYLKAGLVVLILLFLITLYLTHARGGWLGLFGSLSSFVIIGLCPKGKRLLITVFLIVMLIILAITPLGVRFIITQLQGDVRPAIWQGTVYMITEKPWLGWGKGAYFIFYPIYRIQEYWLTKSPTDLTIHAHNEFLQICAETGLVGIIVFLLLIYTVLRLSIREIDRIPGPQRHLLLGLICGIIGLLLHNLVCNNLQMPSSAVFLWYMLGLVISYLPSRALTVNVHGISRYGIFLALTLLIAIINIQTVIRPSVSQYLFKKGWQYRDTERWGLAIEEYKKAIRLYPWDVEMHYRMAYAYTRDGAYAKAIEKYNDVVRLAPLYGSVHRNMGIIYMKMGEDRLAIKSFLQELRINECDLITQVNLSRIRGRHGNK